MATFKAANMREWTERQKANGRLIVSESIEELGRIAQTPKAKGGRMPVREGFLRNSYTASLSGSTALTGPDVYIAVLGEFQMGDTFFAGWTMAYAMRMEKGFVGTDRLGRRYNQQGNFFMENALMQWAAINEKNAKRILG